MMNQSRYPTMMPPGDNAPPVLTPEILKNYPMATLAEAKASLEAVQGNETPEVQDAIEQMIYAKYPELQPKSPQGTQQGPGSTAPGPELAKGKPKWGFAGK